MKQRIKMQQIWVIMLGIMTFMVCLPAAPAYAEEEIKTVVIANQKVSDEKLTKKQVEDIFLGKKTKWSNNKKIVFVTLDESGVNSAFLKSNVGKTPAQFKTYWKKMVFTGKGKSPKSFKTEKELEKYVSETEGAVGYLNAKTKTTQKIKVVKITEK